uniref:hypothetical protein n=1 Tax=unclassified Erwinia TaxID=2622719 RepID=UPI00403F7F9C
MQFLSRFDFITLVMAPSFWIGAATIVLVTLIMYWVINRLLAVIQKGINSWGRSTIPLAEAARCSPTC